MNALTLQNRPIAELIPYARNPRKNDAVVNKMVAAIREFGFRIPIVAKSDGTVVDGHLRLKAAKELGLTEVPVVLADDLSEAQIKAFRLLANRSANWAEWDEELLKIELEDLAALDFDLDLTGFDFDEIDRQLQSITAEPFTEKPMKPPTVQPVPINRLGDYWQLGDHRVLCGDALDASSYTRLLGDKKADLTISDPPYNVNYGVKIARTSQDRPHSHPILNDNLGKSFPAFLETACQHLIQRSAGGIYLCMATSQLPALMQAFKNHGGYYSTLIVWVKNHFSIGYGDYHRQYETILYGWPDGIDHYWCGDRCQSDVWRIDKPDSNPLHPTMKPVSLITRMISNSSREGDCVLDPFGGSGTTLMACEHTHRHCAMIELEPSYVDTIIERWERHTNQKAIHTDSGLTYEALRQARLAEQNESGEKEPSHQKKPTSTPQQKKINSRDSE